MTKTEKEFRSSDVLRAALYALLNDPVLKRARDIVRVVPVTMPQPQPGIHYDLTVARDYAIACGVNRAFTRLEELCSPVSTSDANLSESDREEFTDHLDPAQFNLFKKE